MFQKKENQSPLQLFIRYEYDTSIIQNLKGYFGMLSP
jgi:hypothetical protein